MVSLLITPDLGCALVSCNDKDAIFILGVPYRMVGYFCGVQIFVGRLITIKLLNFSYCSLEIKIFH